MNMTDEEIRRSYRGARCPKHQLQILADLNATTVEKIEHIIKTDPNPPKPPPPTPTPPTPRKYQPPIHRTRTNYTDEDVKKITSLWASGYSCAYIAQQLGCHESRIYNFTTHHRNLCPPRRSIITEAQINEIIRRRSNGEEFRDIAKIVGCSLATAYKYGQYTAPTNQTK